MKSNKVAKHDTEKNWKKAKNFIPKLKELIIYDPDENISYPRFKIGDGIHNVSDLPFYVDENNQNYSWNNF